MISDRRVRYFLALAADLHFGRAAARLGISQPSLSQQIMRLEEEVGVRLLDRNGGVRLTEAGRVLAERSRPAIERIDDAITAAREVGGVAAAVRLAVPRRVYLRHPILEATVARLRREFPATRLHLSELLSGPAVAALRAGEVDAAVLYAPVDAEEIEVLPLLSEQLMVAVPHGHPLADRAGIRIADLRGERILTWGRDVFPEKHDELLAACRRSGFEPEVVTVSPVPGVLTRAVGDGTGVAFVSESWAAGWTGSGVAFRPLSRPKIVMSLVLAWDPDDERPVRRAVIDAARIALQDHPGGPPAPGRG